jgi:hypothetical protein
MIRYFQTMLRYRDLLYFLLLQGQIQADCSGICLGHTPAFVAYGRVYGRILLFRPLAE